jgi:uncharacterized protein with PQ loop repeat
MSINDKWCATLRYLLIEILIKKNFKKIKIYIFYNWTMAFFAWIFEKIEINWLNKQTSKEKVFFKLLN